MCKKSIWQECVAVTDAANGCRFHGAMRILAIGPGGCKGVWLKRCCTARVRLPVVAGCRDCCICRKSLWQKGVNCGIIASGRFGTRLLHAACSGTRRRLDPAIIRQQLSNISRRSGRRQTVERILHFYANSRHARMHSDLAQFVVAHQESLLTVCASQNFSHLGKRLSFVTVDSSAARERCRRAWTRTTARRKCAFRNLIACTAKLADQRRLQRRHLEPLQHGRLSLTTGCKHACREKFHLSTSWRRRCRILRQSCSR